LDRGLVGPGPLPVALPDAEGSVLPHVEGREVHEPPPVLVAGESLGHHLPDFTPRQRDSSRPGPADSEQPPVTRGLSRPASSTWAIPPLGGQLERVGSAIRRVPRTRGYRFPPEM